MDKSLWKVYLLECLDGSVYTGITNNIEKRMISHKKGTGSKYVYRKGFKELLAYKECENRSIASKTEYMVKQMSRLDKLKWFNLI